MRLFIAALLGVALLSSVAFTKAGQEWAQLNMSPAQRNWFNQQKEPGTGKPCCNTSDGEEVQEDIHDGVYWVKSAKTGGEWLPVPATAIITEPNKWGQPIAWFFYENGYPKVRCFSPGALL